MQLPSAKATNAARRPATSISAPAASTPNGTTTASPAADVASTRLRSSGGVRSWRTVSKSGTTAPDSTPMTASAAMAPASGGSGTSPKLASG
jgi:hypothetical protein